jgi:hypothetical protein
MVTVNAYRVCLLWLQLAISCHLRLLGALADKKLTHLLCGRTGVQVMIFV